MKRIIKKKPELVYNSITSNKQTITIAEFNSFINILQTQANINTEHIALLHSILFGAWDNSTTGNHEYDTQYDRQGLIDFIYSVITHQGRVGMDSTIVADNPPDSSEYNIWIKPIVGVEPEQYTVKNITVPDIPVQDTPKEPDVQNIQVYTEPVDNVEEQPIIVQKEIEPIPTQKVEEYNLEEPNERNIEYEYID